MQMFLRFFAGLSASLCLLLMSVAEATAADAGSKAEPQRIPLSFELFEQAWRVEFREGAEGSWQVSTDAQGQAVLTLTKHNSLGHIVLRTAEPLKLQTPQQYRFRGEYWSADAPLGALLLFRMAADPAILSYDSIDRSAGYRAHSLILNAPDEQTWQRRVIHHQATSEPRYACVVLHGNPLQVKLRGLELTSEPFGSARNQGGQTPAPVVSDEQLDQLLLQRPMGTARIRSQEGRSHLELNGQRTMPAFYKDGLYVGRLDHQRFSEAGVPVSIVPVRLHEAVNQPGIWQGKGRYDYSQTEELLRQVLRQNPHGALVLEFWIYPYATWGLEHPEDSWQNAEGQFGYGRWGNLEGFTDDLSKVDRPKQKAWPYPSYHSSQWRADSSQALQDLLEHLKTTPLWHAVVGFVIAGGHDLQFQVVNGRTDFSPAARRDFQAWCQERYGVIEKLNHAWKTSLEHFDQITLPASDAAVRSMEASPPYVNHGRDLDHRLFLEDRTWQLRDHYGRIFKEAAGKEVITMVYGNPVLYRFQRFFKSPHLDTATSMSIYPYRNVGHALGYMQESTFALHNKLFVQEVDLRSWVGTSYGRGEVYLDWIGGGMDLQQWEAIHRKLVGFSLAGNHGHWYYDMNWYFNDPQIMEKIHSTLKVVDKHWARPAQPYRPDTVVIIKDDAEKFISARMSTLLAGLDLQNMHFETSGVPYDVHYLEDVLANPQLHDYRLFIFYHTPYLTADERRAIDRLLKRGGRTLVWMNDAGYIDDRGPSVEAMSELIGMQVSTEGRYGRRSVQLLPESEHPLLAGVPGFAGMSEVMATIMRTEGQNSHMARYQLFQVEDARVQPLARDQHSGEVVIAHRSLKDWTSLYLAAPNSLDAHLLNNIAREARLYVAGEAGQSISMNGSFLSLHGLKNARYTLAPPPGRQQIVDADSGQVLASEGAAHTFDVQVGRTYWFFFE